MKIYFIITFPFPTLLLLFILYLFLYYYYYYILLGVYAGVGNKLISFGGKAVTIRAETPNLSVIELELLGTAFLFTSGETSNSVVDGLVIQNALGVVGGAILIENSSPTIQNCVFITNSSGRFWISTMSWW